jgi:hypothetical protein
VGAHHEGIEAAVMASISRRSGSSGRGGQEARGEGGSLDVLLVRKKGAQGENLLPAVIGAF